MRDGSLTSGRVCDRPCARLSECDRKRTRRVRGGLRARRRWVGGVEVPADLSQDVEKELKRLLRRKSPPPRTSTILQELWAGIDPGRTVTAEHVRIWAHVLKVTLARGAEAGSRSEGSAGGRPKGPGKKFSPYRERAHELRRQGMRPADIARELGVGKSQVTYLLKDFDPNASDGSSKITE